MIDDALMALLRRTADAVGEALATSPSRQLLPGSASQHVSDLATDRAALEVLHGAGVTVLSEESGVTRPNAPDRELDGVTVVVDPLDGSTNAAAGLPWYATSLCAVDDAGPRVALVRNLATGDEFTAVRGHGATRGGVRLMPASEAPAPERAVELGGAIVALSGHAARHLGWRQYRALGALALDLCAVAAGQLDAYLDCSVDAHGVWDYLGGVLVLREVGLEVADVHGRELVMLDPRARRTPVAGPAGLVEALRSRWPQASGHPLRPGADAGSAAVSR